jgi:hypothetical protein
MIGGVTNGVTIRSLDGWCDDKNRDEMVIIGDHMSKLPSIALLLLVVGCDQQHDVFPSSVNIVDESAVTGALGYAFHRPGDRSIHIATVDLCEPGIELRATGPGDGTRTVSSFARRTEAVVAINGGHSWGGVPAVSAHDGAFFGTGDAGDLGQAVFGPGLADFVHMFDDYQPGWGHEEVMTGLLTLVHDGVTQHDVLPNDGYTCSNQHPRTLLGLSEDKRTLFMVVVDGRAPSRGRRGMTCGEAADLMLFIGSHWALNLDGGGSTEMVVNGNIVNVPSDGNERPVPTHLAVVRTPGARGHCPDEPAAPPVVNEPPPAQHAVGCGVLQPGESLAPGETRASCDGRFMFNHQRDGNVVLYGPIGPLWASNTSGQDTNALVMQGDGNFVLYGPSGALWHTHTHGHDGAAMAIQNDGNVVIYSNGTALWSTATYGW